MKSVMENVMNVGIQNDIFSEELKEMEVIMERQMKLRYDQQQKRITEYI